MREIKFRFWNTTCNKLVYLEQYKLGDMNGQLSFIDLFNDDRGWIWEQYTGLKDKNGKEIYEGDIVKARWHRAKNARLDTKGEIKFNDGWFYIEDDPDGQDRLGVPIHNCYNIEIIGCIHKDKELLNGYREDKKLLDKAFEREKKEQKEKENETTK